MPYSLGLVDFTIGLLNSVLNLPDGQVKFLGEFKLQMKGKQFFSSKHSWGLVQMNLGLVYAIYSLPKCQAVKLTLVAPWECNYPNRIKSFLIVVMRKDFMTKGGKLRGILLRGIWSYRCCCYVVLPFNWLNDSGTCVLLSCFSFVSRK